MADKKETVILDFQVDTKSAIVSIENLTKANKDLREERKKLDISTQDGAKRVQEINNAIDKNTSVIKANSSALEKQRLNVGNYTNSIKDAAKEINIAGVNVGGLTSKFAAFANPLTAITAGVGFLAAAYASSTTGAKDLEFAHNQLSSATTTLTNKFASLFSSAEDGEGIMSKITNTILYALDPALAATSRLVAMADEKLQDLGRERLKIDATANDLLKINADLKEKLTESQISYNDKVKIGAQIVANLKTIDAARLKNAEEELEQLNIKFKLNKNNESLETAVLQKGLEINEIKKETVRQIANIAKAESNLLDAQNKATSSAAQKAQDARDKDLLKKADGLAKLKIALNKNAEEAMTQSTKEGEEAREAYTKHRAKEFETSTKTMTDAEKKAASDQVKIAFLAGQQKLANISTTLSLAAGLLDQGSTEYKALAISQASIDTYRAATAALTEPPIGVGPVFGPILAAVTIATGLANIAKISGFSQGGYTGPGGKYQPAGTVHKGEVVWNQSDVAAVGGPARANAMRPTYVDGGIVAAGMTRGSGGSMDMPNIEVNLGYKEFNEFTNKVKFKEALSTA